MKSEDLLDLIGDIPDQYITEAVPEEKSKKRFIRPRRIILAASCLAAVLTAVYIMSNFPEYINSFVPSSTDTESQQNTSETGSQTEPGTKFETETLSFLEQEKLNDPIFDWVDPYAEYSLEKDADKLRLMMTADEFNDYISKRKMYELAKENYTLYYYYYSGKSEYNGTRLDINSEYSSQDSFASYAVPQSFILNMRADACVIIKPEKSYVETLDIKFENEATKQKEIEQGGATTYDKEWIIFSVDKCLWGNMGNSTEIAFTPMIISAKLTEELKNPNKTFVAFVFNSNRTVKHDGISYAEYGFVTKNVFDYTSGTLKTYSNIADIIEYDGKTAEEMLESGEALAAKYPELITMDFD